MSYTPNNSGKPEGWPLYRIGIIVLVVMAALTALGVADVELTGDSDNKSSASPTPVPHAQAQFTPAPASTQVVATNCWSNSPVKIGHAIELQASNQPQLVRGLVDVSNNTRLELNAAVGPHAIISIDPSPILAPSQPSYPIEITGSLLPAGVITQVANLTCNGDIALMHLSYPIKEYCSMPEALDIADQRPVRDVIQEEFGVNPCP